MAVTPKRLLKLGLKIDAARRAVVGDHSALGEAQYIVTHADQIAKEGSASMVQHAKQLATALIVPIAEGVIAPKLVDKAVSVIGQGEPLVGRLANAQLLKV